MRFEENYYKAYKTYKPSFGILMKFPQHFRNIIISENEKEFARTGVNFQTHNEVFCFEDSRNVIFKDKNTLGINLQMLLKMTYNSSLLYDYNVQLKRRIL